MSTWERDSDISRYNPAPAGTWQPLPQPFFDVLREALAIAADSGGACDPTVGPLVAAWGFGPDGDGGTVPDAATLADARARTGWRRVALDEPVQRALQPGGVGLDLSGIAKGHGVDAVVAWLRAQGVPAALVEVGGELRGYGRKPDGKAWQVLAEAWPGEDEDEDEDEEGDSGAWQEPLPPCIVVLDDVAVATSATTGTASSTTAAAIRTRSIRAPRARGERSAVGHRGRRQRACRRRWATALTVLASRPSRLAQSRGIAARFVVRDADGMRAFHDRCLQPAHRIVTAVPQSSRTGSGASPFTAARVVQAGILLALCAAALAFLPLHDEPWWPAAPTALHAALAALLGLAYVGISAAKLWRTGRNARAQAGVQCRRRTFLRG